MKKLYIIAALLLIAMGAAAQEGRNIYNKYSGKEGVSAVYISPAMFKLIGQLPELKVDMGEGETVDMAPLIRSFSGFYMLNISDPQSVSALSTDIKTMLANDRSKKHYELLMEVKEEGDNVQIYTAGTDDIIESFVFFCTDSDDEVQFICIDGTMNRSDVESVIVKAASSAM